MRETSPTLGPDLVGRCHENSIYSYRAFAPPGDPTALREDPDLVLIATGSHDSLGNPAFATRPPADPLATVRRVREFFAVHRVPWCLISLPEATPVLKSGATAAGLHDEGTFPGMLLHPIGSVHRDPPPGGSVSMVTTLEQLRAWEATSAAAYGTPPLAPDDHALRLEGIAHFLGYLDGLPAATAILVVHRGIAGIVGVGTVPSQRRRGIAEATVRCAIEEGFRRGCDASFLWATPRGVPVYEKIGFRRIFEYQIWTEPGAPLPLDIRPVH